jgi:AcrR family transcriptional regulator
VTTELLNGQASELLHIADVAEAANVAIPTIYYHFESRTQLIAQAQVLAYARMSAPNYAILVQVELALTTKDEDLFWDAIANLVIFVWSANQTDDRWGMIKLLFDVWSDDVAHRDFCKLVDERFNRWENSFNVAKTLGWIGCDVDVMAPITLFWAASLGQIFVTSPFRAGPTPQTVLDFLLHALRGPNTS